MATSDTEICNLALARLGSDRLVDLANDSDRNARFCVLFFEQALKEILRARPWNFAITRASLPRSTETPAFEWTYMYPIPSDSIHILECNGYNWDRYAQELFVIEKGHILTHAESALVRYVYLNREYSTFPADFVEALATLMASKLAAPITGNLSVAALLREEYERIHLPRAATQHANESREPKVNRILDSDLVRARYTSS